MSTKWAPDRHQALSAGGENKLALCSRTQSPVGTRVWWESVEGRSSSRHTVGVSAERHVSEDGGKERTLELKQEHVVFCVCPGCGRRGSRYENELWPWLGGLGVGLRAGSSPSSAMLRLQWGSEKRRDRQTGQTAGWLCNVILLKEHSV